MELWFYIAKFGDCTDKIIATWTRGPYSHVEMVFPDGECFSSSPRDGGVRFKKINRSNKWSSIKLSIDYNENIRKDCEKYVGLPYDWYGCMGLTLGFSRIEEKNKWYCSEICAFILNKYGAELPSKVSPNTLYKKMINGSKFRIH